MENKPVKIRYVGSSRKGKKIGSELIKWGTKDLHPELEPCSHLAIIVRDTLVIESTMNTGVRIIPYKKWLELNDIIHNFEKPYDGKLSDYLPSILDRMWGKSYDYAGVLYFAWRIILWKFLKKELPKTNAWESEGKRFCVEIFGEKLSMVSPIQMIKKWDKDPEIKRI